MFVHSLVSSQILVLTSQLRLPALLMKLRNIVIHGCEMFTLGCQCCSIWTNVTLYTTAEAKVQSCVIPAIQYKKKYYTIVKSAAPDAVPIKIFHYDMVQCVTLSYLIAVIAPSIYDIVIDVL